MSKTNANRSGRFAGLKWIGNLCGAVLIVAVLLIWAASPDLARWMVCITFISFGTICIVCNLLIFVTRLRRGVFISFIPLIGAVAFSTGLYFLPIEYPRYFLIAPFFFDLGTLVIFYFLIWYIVQRLSGGEIGGE